MTTYLSQKIKVMSFASILLVLYIHSGFHNYTNEIAGMPFNFALQDAISGRLGRLAVPLFYAVSGYLFFRDICFDGTWSEAYSPLWRKMGRRVRSLVVPYALACWFPLLFFVVLEQIPASAAFVNGGGLASVLSLPLPQMLWQVYCDSGTGAPIAFQLYFMRDLICVVALMPALFVPLKVFNNWGGYALLIVFGVITILWSHQFWLARALYWFFFGTCFLGTLERAAHWGIPVAYVLVCIAQVVVPWNEWGRMELFISTLGMTAFWMLYTLIMPTSFDLSHYRWLQTACGFTFFIYLFHEPTLNIVRKLLVLPLGHTSLSFALTYLLSPWLFAALWICVGLAFRRCLPRVYKVLAGSR